MILYVAYLITRTTCWKVGCNQQFQMHEVGKKLPISSSNLYAYKKPSGQIGTTSGEIKKRLTPNIISSSIHLPY